MHVYNYKYIILCKCLSFLSESHFVSLSYTETSTLKNDSSTAIDPKQTTNLAVNGWVASHPALYKTARSIKVCHSNKIMIRWIRCPLWYTRQCQHHPNPPRGQLDLTKSFHLQSKIAISCMILWRGADQLQRQCSLQRSKCRPSIPR